MRNDSVLAYSEISGHNDNFRFGEVKNDPDKFRFGQVNNDLNIVGVHLITAADAFLPEFYERFGFQKDNRLILMGKDL